MVSERSKQLASVALARASLKKVLQKAAQNFEKTDDPFLKAFLVTGNRILLDSEIVPKITVEGYHGSAWTLVAAMIRTRTMIAALHIKGDLVNDFNDEDKWSHTDSKEFRSKFSENGLKRIVSDHFGESFDGKNSFKEVEQILHGSAYALKRWYGKILDTAKGRVPHLTFAPFGAPDITLAILSVVEAIDTELVGIYYEHYPKESYDPNLICSCGSGLKFKECHARKRELRSE